MGDPSKVLLLEKVVQVVKRDNLLKLVELSGACLLCSPTAINIMDRHITETCCIIHLFLYTGKKLMDGLKDLSNRFPQHMKNNVRGIGTFCAFDLTSPQKRDEAFFRLQQHGLFVNYYT